MPVNIPLHLFSHHRKIANLYKKWLRGLEGSRALREHYLFEKCLVRADFDKIYNEKDVRKSKAMLLEKEASFANTFPIPPIIFPSSPGGVAYDREAIYDDRFLDEWHPLEKAAYPEYFARREIRKQQYIEMWQKLHGPPKPEDYESH